MGKRVVAALEGNGDPLFSFIEQIEVPKKAVEDFFGWVKSEKISKEGRREAKDKLRNFVLEREGVGLEIKDDIWKRRLESFKALSKDPNMEKVMMDFYKK